MSAGFTVRLKNDLADVARLLELLSGFGRSHALPERTIGNLALALDELLTNVIVYGVPPPQGAFDIDADVRLEDGCLVAEITDPGVPFNPFEEGPEPDLTASLQERRIGGLGIFLVKQLMDETAYRRVGAMNHIRIAKLLAAG